MNRDAGGTPHIRVHRVTFPWLSTLGGLLAVTYLLVATEAGLAAFYELPGGWLQPGVKYGVFVLVILLVLADLRRYRRQYAHQKADLERVRQQVDDLWARKKHLQLKAHTYSDHADKLKLFISDRLLDYIEYDEKFLHFKGIAAEVRHNGVISFDKVQTALQQAAASVESSPDQPTGSATDRAADYQAALDAMRYLWDLLDLSTADNLALHISNLQAECEEHYCQRMLDVQDSAVLPYEPAYRPQRAAWRALGLVRQDALPPPDNETPWTLDDDQWHVRLDPADELLGKENHLVLLLENLLRNAQFFSRKRGYSTPCAPIALTLVEDRGYACFRVYNRGPQIRDEDLPNLFQLGFSTRRTRGHHGRGLGLYFVNEIVKGHDGRIGVHNIHTPEARYVVTIDLENGETITDTVSVVIEDGQPRCRGDDGDLAEVRAWTFGSPLSSVTVGDGDGRTKHRLEDFDRKGRQSRFDPAHPARPHWRLIFQPRRNNHRLHFEPLDISGVEFEVRLPTAQQRLDSGGWEDDDDHADVEPPDRRLRAPVSSGSGS